MTVTPRRRIPRAPQNAGGGAVQSLTQTPRRKLPPVPKAAAALAQADALLQAGQPLPRALWADLSLRAPEKELERLLRATLRARVDLEQTVIPCQDDDAHIAQALTRLVHVAQAMHLSDPSEFCLQNVRLFLTYVSRHPEAPSAAAQALLSEFDPVLRRIAHPVDRLSALRTLLSRIDPDDADDTFDFQALCEQVLRVLSSTHIYRIAKQGRADVLNDLLRLVRPFDTASEDIWAATARRLKEKDDSIVRALEQKRSQALAAITGAPEPGAHPDLTPGFVGALTQVEVLTLTGQTLTRAAWAELSLHAPEYELRRLLRTALAEETDLHKLFTLPAEDQHLQDALTRLVRVTEALHLSEPQLFKRQSPMLFRAYLSRRPEPRSAAAREMLQDFDTVLFRSVFHTRLRGHVYLLENVSADDEFDFQQLCTQAIRHLRGTNGGGPAGIRDRSRTLGALIRLLRPQDAAGEEIWTATATLLKMDDSYVTRTIGLHRTGQLD